MKITPRLSLCFLALALIPLALVTGLTTRQAESGLRHEVLSRVQALAGRQVADLLDHDAALEAGAAILTVYNGPDFEVRSKSDASPVTEADEKADAIIAHARKYLAPFKVPRFYTFVDDFPRTVSLKIAKPQISAGIADLRAGSFDRVENRWIQEG